MKYEVLKAGTRAKYEQNQDLMNAHLATGDSILAEAHPRDQIWGIGMDAVSASALDSSLWLGENLLVKALMELREGFRCRHI